MILGAALIFSAGVASAAPISLDVDVTAYIPSSTSLDVYDVGGWASAPLAMNYDRINKTLSAVGGPLQIIGGTTGVEAYLSFAPQLVSGADSIPLLVSVGGVGLAVGSAAAVQVATAAEAAAGKRVQLVVAAAPATGTGYATGTYSGPVHMLFDSVPP
jgi:hypothetical protein